MDKIKINKINISILLNNKTQKMKFQYKYLNNKIKNQKNSILKLIQIFRNKMDKILILHKFNNNKHLIEKKVIISYKKS
jgi:hypothetical protein